MDNTLFRLDGAVAGYGPVAVLDRLDLSLPAGRVTALCGPNGCGKSTVLRSLRRLLPLQSGDISLLDRNLKDWSQKDLARSLAMLSQSPEAPPEMTVAELVMLGRYAHRKPLAGPSVTDRDACRRALAATGLSALEDHTLGALSGGQKQRAWIAMVLAQESGTILLDEPTNHLDVSHAMEVLELVRRLNREAGRSVVVVLHDLNLAARYADHVVLLDRGRVVAEGDVSEVLTEDLLSQVYHMDFRILCPADLSYPVIVPLQVREPEMSSL